jgi:hypothetical protein
MKTELIVFEVTKSKFNGSAKPFKITAVFKEDFYEKITFYSDKKYRLDDLIVVDSGINLDVFHCISETNRNINAAKYEVEAAGRRGLGWTNAYALGYMEQALSINELLRERLVDQFITGIVKE